MHRIDCPTATPDNKFTEGDPTIPVAATTVTADWLNAVQEELAAVILAADAPLDKESNTQLRDALLALITRRGPFLTCATPAATAIKNLEAANFSLVPGAKVYLRFDEVNTAENPQISINGGEATPLRYQGMPVEVGNLAKGQVYEVIYTGEDWQILAGMARWGVGQFDWWQDTLLRPGLVPCNGCAIEGANQYPQILAYLGTPHGQARCFASLAEREAAHVAVWGDGTFKANWAGVGGLAKYYYDAANDVLYMPDLVGCFEAMAADGTIAPSMEAVKGDVTRAVMGQIIDNYGGTNMAGTGAFEGTFSLRKMVGTADNMRYGPLTFDSSRASTTGAANIPRSFGALLCTYLGQPSGA